MLFVSFWHCYAEDYGIYIKRGNDHVGKAEYRNAINNYTKAIGLNPSRADTHYSRGLAYASLGQYRNAINDYTKAIGLNPSRADTHYSRGLAHASLGQYDKGCSDWKQACILGTCDAYERLKNTDICTASLIN